MKKIALLFILTTALFSIRSYAQIKADDITGIWQTGGEEPARIQIYKAGNKFYGKIIWLKNPIENGKPKIDGKNPAKEKRNNPVIGLIILKEFKFDGDDEWEDGNIYDPESGKTYSCYMFLNGKNTLKVRGYVGISLFGRTETWTRTD